MVLDLAWETEGQKSRTLWEIRAEVGPCDDKTGDSQGGDRMCRTHSVSVPYSKADWENVKTAAKKSRDSRAQEWQKAVEARDWDRTGEILEQCRVESVAGGMPEARSC